MLPGPEQFVADFNSALVKCWRTVVPDPYPTLAPWPIPELAALCEAADPRVQEALLLCTDRRRLQQLQEVLEHMVLPPIEAGRFSPTLQSPLELAGECIAYCSSVVDEEHISARLQIQAACNEYLSACARATEDSREILFPWHVVFRAVVLDRLEHIPDECSVLFFPSPKYYDTDQDEAAATRIRKKKRFSWLPQTPRQRQRPQLEEDTPEVIMAESQLGNENDAPQLRDEQEAAPPRKMVRREEENFGRGAVRLKQDLLLSMLEEKRQKQERLLLLAESAAQPLEL